MNRRPFVFILVLALAAAACSGLRSRPAGSAPPPATATQAPLGQAGKPEQARTFRMMTFNIHHGEGVDGRIDLERIAAVIRDERADIVALQEVDKGVERTARRDLAEELSKLTGMKALFSNTSRSSIGTRD